MSVRTFMETEHLSLDIHKLRADFPALRNYIWFQNGGVSITPIPVADEHARLIRELLERGPMHIVYPDEEYPRRRRTMERLARFFSVEPSELALMRGVSEGYQTVLRGLEWQAGDRIVIRSCGAYTSTYASVGFNGFPPLDVVVI